MKYIVLCLVALITFSCNLDDGNGTPPEAIDFRAQNEEEIIDYLSENELVSQTTASGLHFIIENQGDGDKPTASSNVSVVYRGTFLNGNVFDESTAEGIAIGLDRVILGWREGIPLFNVGGKGTLIIPAHLAYGSFNTNGIPGGSVLVFDIELLAVN